MVRNKYNTPGIIKYPFWQQTYRNPDTFYASINNGNVYIPKELEGRSLNINADIAETVESVIEAYA
jgi:hypothetical protein